MNQADGIDFGDPLVDSAPSRLRAFSSVDLRRHTFEHRRPL